MGLEIIGIFFHHGPALLQQSLVTEALIVAIGHQIHRIRPANGLAGGLVHHLHALIGQHRRQQAVFILGICHIPQPLAEEGGSIHQIRAGVEEDLGIAGPAQALSGGAVRGQLQEIAFHTPKGIAVELIDQRIGTCKCAGLLHIGIDGDCLDVFKIYIAIDLHVSETENGKAGLIVVYIAGSREADLLQGGNGGNAGGLICHQLHQHSHLVVPLGWHFLLDILHIHMAICIQNLAAEQPEGFSCATFDGELQVASDVLPKIQHPGAIFCNQHLGRQPLLFLNRHIVGRHQRCLGCIHNHRAATVRRFHKGIVHFAVL